MRPVRSEALLEGARWSRRQVSGANQNHNRAAGNSIELIGQIVLPQIIGSMILVMQMAPDLFEADA
jgi:hypothetical protein